MQERRLLLQLCVMGSLRVALEEKELDSLIAAIIFALVHFEAKHTLSNLPSQQKGQEKPSISKCITKNACLTRKKSQFSHHSGRVSQGL